MNYTATRPEHELRVIIESTELMDKAQKLFAFIESEKFEALPIYDRYLLSHQFKYMAKYCEILRVRIAIFDAAKKSGPGFS